MRLVSVRLSGIRSFSETSEIPLFEDAERLKLLTISGPNGSGKSSLVDSIACIQTAGILEAVRKRVGSESLLMYEIDFIRRLGNLVSKPEASIRLYLEDEGTRGSLLLEIRSTHGVVNYSLSAEGTPGKSLLDSWGANEPQNLILTIPSTKYFEQADIFFTQLKTFEGEEVLLGDPDSDAYIRPFVVNSTESIRHSYRAILEDWFYERIVPGKKRTVFNTVGKIFLKSLFPGVEITNFSATSRSGEIIAQAKRVDLGSRSYDVRSLSSGEKYGYFVFTHLVHISDLIGHGIRT